MEVKEIFTWIYI